MNNTFCLFIFLALVFARELVWEFSAETLSILLVQVIVALLAQKTVMTTLDSCFVLSLYPLSLAFVAVAEAAGLN